MNYIINSSRIITLLLLLFTPPNISAQNEIYEELSSTWEAFANAWESENAKACASYFFPEAKNLPLQAEEVKGQQAIAKMYAGLFDEHQSAKYNHKIKEFIVLDGHVLEEGNLVVDWVRNDGSTWQFNAKTLTLWKKNDAGQWRIMKFMFN